MVCLSKNLSSKSTSSSAAVDKMGESVQLLKMKQYTISGLSSNDKEDYTLPDVKSISNGGMHVNEKNDVSKYYLTPTSAKENNGFIADKEYGDWDR